MKKTLMVFIGAVIIELIIASLLKMDIPKISTLMIATHTLTAIWATYVYTGKLINGGKR